MQRQSPASANQTANVMNPCKLLATARPRAPSQPTLRDIPDVGGLFHVTSIPAPRRILRDNAVRPAAEKGAPTRGAGIASRVRRLGGISLWDVLSAADAARLGPGSNPARSWLGTWLTFHAPVTAVICLDKARLLAQGGKLLNHLETQRLAPGLMLKGEVGHLGILPLTGIMTGFLFVRRHTGTGLVSRYVAGYTLAPATLRNTIAHLHRASKQKPFNVKSR
jgi:hypothetical protein